MTEKLVVSSPFSGEVLDELELISKEELEALISSAYKLFKDPSKVLPPYRRIEILEKTAELLENQKDDFIRLAASEGGKPLVDTEVEVDRAIQGIKLGATSLHHNSGTEIPMGLTKPSTGRLAFTRREAIGVVASISAFNHPLNLIVHQTVPAIAVGCPVIIKPAALTPLSCIKLVKLFHQAGLPEEWCRSIVCGRTEAEALVTDKRIGFFSFIGSPKVGWSLRSKLAPGTRAALEHGGAAPVLIDKNIDTKEVLPLLSKGGFYHAGQVCVSVQRVFAPKASAQKIAEELGTLAKNLKVGDPLDRETEVGPLISNREVDRVEEWVKEAVEGGAKIICGGDRISESCFEPTVLLDPPNDARVSKQEIFGPVVCVYSYESWDEAIDRSNSLDFAFQASVFTNNLDLALDASARLNATAVMVNDHTAFRVDWMPFGGRDTSGLGMGGIPYSMHEMTREKMTVIRSKNLL